jgi:hypothetical protein
VGVGACAHESGLFATVGVPRGATMGTSISSDTRRENQNAKPTQALAVAVAVLRARPRSQSAESVACSPIRRTLSVDMFAMSKADNANAWM